MERRPTLLSSCARAATSAEARFRVNYPNSRGRASRIVALDEDADSVIRRVARLEWAGARFLTLYVPNGRFDDHQEETHLRLLALDGSTVPLGTELVGADLVVMVATSDRGSIGASIIGGECSARGIMTVGLVLSANGEIGNAVQALRPNASVLVVAADEGYVGEMLTALRV